MLDRSFPLIVHLKPTIKKSVKAAHVGNLFPPTSNPRSLLLHPSIRRGLLLFLICSAYLWSTSHASYRRDKEKSPAPFFRAYISLSLSLISPTGSRRNEIPEAVCETPRRPAICQRTDGAPEEACPYRHCWLFDHCVSGDPLLSESWSSLYHSLPEHRKPSRCSREAVSARSHQARAKAKMIAAA